MEQGNKNRVLVVGGGISGLATAFYIEKHCRLNNLDLDLTLFEQESKLGGRMFTFRDKGYCIEEGANGFLNSKPPMLELSRDIGLFPILMPADQSAKSRYVLQNGNLVPIPINPKQFIGSSLISWKGKIRLLFEPLIPKGPNNGIEESVYAFGCRRIGKEATAKLLDAFVTGIHAADFKILSVNAAFPRIVEIEQKYGSLFKALFKIAGERKKSLKSKTHEPIGAPSGTLTSFPQGMSTFIDALSSKIHGKILRGVSVKSLEKNIHSGWSLVDSNENTWHGDVIVLATPAFQQTEILRKHHPELSSLLSLIPYNSITMVGLGFQCEELQKLPKGFGYIAPQLAQRDVLGVLWTSSFFNDRAPKGKFLMRALCGGWNRPDIVDWDDCKLVEAVRKELKSTMNISAKPTYVHIKKWKHGIPQYHVGHLEKLSHIENALKPLKGLFLTGNSFYGVAMNDCAEKAALTGERAANFLSQIGTSIP